MKCSDRSLLDFKNGEEGVHVVQKKKKEEFPALFSTYICMLKLPAVLQRWSFVSSKAELLTVSPPVIYIIDKRFDYITCFFLLFTTHSTVIQSFICCVV